MEDVASRLLLARAMAATAVHSHLSGAVHDIATAYNYDGRFLVLNSPFDASNTSLPFLREIENLGVALRVWAGMSWSAIARERGYRNTSRANGSPNRSSDTPSRQSVHRSYSAEVNRLLQHASGQGPMRELTGSTLALIVDNRTSLDAVGRSHDGSRLARSHLLQNMTNLVDMTGLQVSPYQGLEAMQRELEEYLWDRLSSIRMTQQQLEYQADDWRRLREREDRWWVDVARNIIIA